MSKSQFRKFVREMLKEISAGDSRSSSSSSGDPVRNSINSLLSALTMKDLPPLVMKQIRGKLKEIEDLVSKSNPEEKAGFHASPGDTLTRGKSPANTGRYSIMSRLTRR